MNDRCGSNPEVSDGHENVSCWGQSGPRFRATGGPFVAEGVEKVRTIKIFAPTVRVSRACSNFDSTKPRILNHCFKNFELRDFFNSLSQKEKSVLLARRSSTGR
jgi:hypothetical protein